MISGVEFSPTLVILFLLAIVFSLAGGLLLGYFVGRTRNGLSDEIDVVDGRLLDLSDRLTSLHAEVAALAARLPSTDEAPP